MITMNLFPNILKVFLERRDWKNDFFLFIFGKKIISNFVTYGRPPRKNQVSDNNNLIDYVVKADISIDFKSMKSRLKTDITLRVK